MNSYEEKIGAKRERYKRRAEKIRKEANEKYEAGTKALEAIPFGQPILVGHHSERGDRNYRNKAVGKIQKSFELSDKAKRYEDKAESIGTAGISSDDPDAIAKLKVKLKKLETYQAMMREDNASARKQKLEPLFARYQLSNNNNNIRSVKQRIAQLEKMQNAEEMADITGDGWKFTESKEENRYMFIFDGKPAQEIIGELKRRGFKWSPSRKAWVRQRTDNGRYAVKYLINFLQNNGK